MTIEPKDGRIVCHFSCGAASAVATKLAIEKYGPDNLVIFNAFIKEEDDDNRRFLADCEKWFGHPVTVLRDEKYGASARQVWRTVRFIKSAYGAPCAINLKREVIEAQCLPNDRHVFGFTYDEKEKVRVKRFLANGVICPLIDRQLTKGDCFSILNTAGIVLPKRYRDGWNNANCSGCCKGGMGYWNKTRRDQPEVFEEMAQIEESLGPGAYLFFDKKTGKRFSLRELPPDAGRHDEPVPDCSLFCEEVEEELGLREDSAAKAQEGQG